MFTRSVKFILASAFFAASVGSAFADAANDEKMKKLATNAGCFTCHAVSGKGPIAPGTDKPIGPAWLDVAKMYSGKPGAADFLTRVVLEGSNPYSSHWKNKVTGAAMPPNTAAISETDARSLVFWILSMK
jgi:cytochrome c